MPEAALPDMLSTRITCDSDAELARLLATHAGVVLLRLRVRPGLAADRLRREGDTTSHSFLASALARLRPADAVLSEEGKDDPSRLDAKRVWIVDPLDGTREYAESDRTDWAVHVALLENGELVAGAVALPGLGPTLATDNPPRPAGRHRGRLRMLVSRSRPPEYAAAVAERLDADLIPMGSAGAKAMAVVRGEADLYLHDGGQYEWDSAAPVAVAVSAGLHASRVDGSPMSYNNADPYQPDLLISRAELAEPALAAIAAVR